MPDKRSTHNDSHYQEDVSVLRDFATMPLNKRTKYDVDQVEIYNPQHSTDLKYFTPENSWRQNLNGSMTQSGCHSSSGHTRSGVWPPRSAPILTRMPSNSSQAVIDGNGKKYEHLENRLKTFSQWQGLLDYRSMAEAGFVYTGQEDLVFCFHCNIKLDRWSKDMEPLLRHKEESPTCSFMRQRLQAVKRERGKTISVVAPSKPLNSRLTSSIGQLQSSSLVTSKSIHTVVTGLNEPRLSYGGSFDDCPGASLPITPENYQCEAERIKSFVGWPLNEAVHPEQLARVGFVYTGEGALVQCFQCGVKYRHWYKGDVPLNIHQKCNPRCPFLQTLACKSKSSLTEQSPTKSYIESDSAGSNAKGEEVDKYSLQFPDYSDQAIRLQSFKHWGGVLPAQELAEGGFYMIGRLDRVKCFACDVVLHDWERNDNVINEHHKHSPNCRFLRGLTSKTTVTIIVPSKTPSVQSRLELSAETEAGFLSSRPIGSLPPSDNQEVMVPGVCHHPCAYSQEENLSNTRDYFHSPTRSVDSRSASPKNECFKYAGAYHEVGDDVPTCSRYKPEHSPPQVVRLCQICYEKKIRFILLPCGHANTCEECRASRCPQCGKTVEIKHRVFL